MSRLLAGVIAAAMLFLGGCQTWSGVPHRSGDVEEELKLLDRYFKPDVTTAPTGKTPQDWRDEVLNGRIRAIDLQYTQFESAVWRESSGMNIATDWIVIALNFVGVVHGSSGTKTVLHAISGGVVATKGSIDKNIFFDKTMPALVAKMESLRSKQMAIIQQKLEKERDENAQRGTAAQYEVRYTIGEVLRDTDRYFEAGTIPAAIKGIVESAGAESAEANNTIRAVTATKTHVKDARSVRSHIDDLRASIENNAPAAAAARTAAITKLNKALDAVGVTVRSGTEEIDKVNLLQSQLRTELQAANTPAKLDALLARWKNALGL